ncbi:hypothetical protein BDN71DRAFT_1429527 [Pleurotus eryngii]|uniref:Uncharacterized protein n=1 Tax=Pleurotus eryngii TaxID=5323 RepID=A0A9P6A335_PLEER|nr:hypothetical protein BDN71DRAFT_1429527 [Pleurotus eryngii]
MWEGQASGMREGIGREHGGWGISLETARQSDSVASSDGTDDRTKMRGEGLKEACQPIYVNFEAGRVAGKGGVKLVPADNHRSWGHYQGERKGKGILTTGVESESAWARTGENGVKVMGHRGKAGQCEGEVVAAGAAEGLSGDRGGGKSSEEVLFQDELDTDDRGGREIGNNNYEEGCCYEMKMSLREVGEGVITKQQVQEVFLGIKPKFLGCSGDTGDWVGLRLRLVWGLGWELGRLENQDCVGSGRNGAGVVGQELGVYE